VAAFVDQISPELITSGKNTVINSRPTKAGLNLFLPTPPQRIFPNKTAQEPPKAATYQGVKGEIVKTSSNTVIMAEPSKIPFHFFKKIPENRISVKIAPTKAEPKTIKTRCDTCKMQTHKVVTMQ